ncbi:MAG: leucyl aminopeptidase [Deltaproteobacteria bacterium]|nr:leucyl aminopeptidase [Deltaproteobacteria bacterium]
MRQEVKQAELRAETVNWVRDLVNEPPNLLGPVELEQEAREMAGREGLRMTVLGDKAIKNRGMGLLASVAAGTRQGAKLLHLRHLPEGPVRGRVALVGKGVTFDSGGLSLKPPSSQPDMKSDMAGAATVLGIMRAVAQENLPWEVHGIVPTCENMPGPGATRPGDVFQSMSGKTVEVRNTDAEGRLILADALTYAKELKPDLIVDFATLTGACVVALGSLTAGVFGNKPEWNERAKAAADKAGELVWPMPLEPGLKSELRSNVADLRNTGSRWGGAISAALFLEEFVDKTPWLHFDIAGPGFLDKTHGFHPKGGTGFGVLSLLSLLGLKGTD